MTGEGKTGFWGAALIVACLSHMTIDYASLSRWSRGAGCKGDGGGLSRGAGCKGDGRAWGEGVLMCCLP